MMMMMIQMIKTKNKLVVNLKIVDMLNYIKNKCLKPSKS